MWYKPVKHTLTLVALSILFFLLIAGCITSSPPTPTPQVIITCTLLGCHDTLHVSLTGTIPRDYTMKVTAESGETMQIRCIDGVGQDEEHTKPNASSCQLDGKGVTFFNFVPERATVTVTWNNNEISQAVAPECSLYRPNGPNCEPECRSCGVVINIPANSQ